MRFANHEVLLYTSHIMDLDLEAYLHTLSTKKATLDAYRPLPEELVSNLEEWFRVELTYASNAIEGNTLTRSETALVVEKGLTVRGKSLREHLEAVNHAEALDYVATLARQSDRPITRNDILSLHSLILGKIDDENAGRFRTIQVRIAGAEVVLPAPIQVPLLMDDFISWLNTPHAKHTAQHVADAHLRFVTIHPFVDGNGRLGRLLLNLMLIRGGYPPALIRKEDREEYIASLETAQLSDAMFPYYRVIYRAVERSLDIYLQALQAEGAISVPEAPSGSGKARLLKIGELAGEVGESVPTIRYWTKEGLLAVTSKTKGGYALYDPSMVSRAMHIRRLQRQERLTIAEIRDILGKPGSANDNQPIEMIIRSKD